MFYQIVYKIKPKHSLSAYHSPIELHARSLNFVDFSQQNYANENKQFFFLNLEKKFTNKIDWNFNEFGKLWNYNLQYLNCLNQDNLSKYYKCDLLEDIHNDLYSGELVLEPYPTSLRIINTVRFLNTVLSHPNKEKVNSLLKAVYSQTLYLKENLEFHILGNHLLENAFALLVSAEFFNNHEWKIKATEILKKQLDEQICKDGAHFELSPMYHQIILARVLEAISICSDESLKLYLIEKSKVMLAWLELITFNNGSIPHLNDSADNITYTSEELFSIAKKLNINYSKLNQFKDSGYRKYSDENYELLIDVNGIAPSYQPGHAHSDHLSFVMNAFNKPFVVDPGISTYNISKRRDWERSSVAHNTVTVNNVNQSEVWGGFRVAKRAKVAINDEQLKNITATVNYNISNVNVSHIRQLFFNKDEISIIDDVNKNIQSKCVARYYLHPSIEINLLNNAELLFNNNLKMEFMNHNEMNVVDYKFAVGYNNLVDAKFIEVIFDKHLVTKIKQEQI